MVRHPQAASGVVDVLHSSGVDLPQAGHDLQPEEVPGRGAGVGVGGVLHVGDVAGGGVGRQLRRVARGLRVEVAVDAVGLEIEDDQPLRLVPEAVHHALQQHLFPGCRRVIVRRVGQNGEFELTPERPCG